ncbi:MAG TPA: hypothetical protein VHA37_00775, partial [Candidatus Saccharimonadales bacterium]|nr:hypothetical protein [Candidatus Saccharimonadales bacterium]
GGLSSQFATALGQFNAGWIALQAQFAAGAALVQRAGAAGGSQLLADLDLVAANQVWQAELPALKAFIALVAEQQANDLTGDYLYTRFPPCPGLTIGEPYYLGYGNAWLQAAVAPPHDIVLLNASASLLAPADAQYWTFEPIAESCGCY